MQKSALMFVILAVLLPGVANAQEPKIVVHSAGPRLTGAEAAAVLQRASPDRDASRIYVASEPASIPLGKITRSSPTDGPFGPFPKYEFPPLVTPGVISIPLPYPTVRIIRDKRHR